MFLTVCLNPTLQKTLCFPSIVPGTVNRSETHRFDVSGKGINVTRVLTQLGKKAVHLTQLGGDMRPLFLSLCEQDGLSIEWAESKSQIRFCYTLITENDSNVTELVEESEPVAAGTEQSLLEKFDKIISDSSLPVTCLIISGTKAAGFSYTLYPTMVKKAKEKGLIVVLDIRGKDLINSLLYKPDIIKPNLFEFASSFAPDLIKNNDFPADDAAAFEKIKSIALDICRKFSCRIILTNSSRSIYAAGYEKFYEIDIKPIIAINSIGCGDAFTAGFAAALASCKNPEDEDSFNAAINEGIRCGGLNADFIKPGVIY